MSGIRRLIYVLLPLQMLVLLLSPRFGWSIHNLTAEPLRYRGVSYEDGAFHCIYQNGGNTVDISYGNPFSKRFAIVINDEEEYSMHVKMDGASVESEPDMLPGIANDIVWKDTYGILFWRCILTAVMSVISTRMLWCAGDAGGVEKKLLCVGATIIYVIALLISLRVLF